jgi:hypothetical protein
MHSVYALYRAVSSPRARRVLQRAGAEVSALVGALLNSGQLVAEVEGIHKLKTEADRIEGRQPARAAALRREAAMRCLS